MSFDVILLPSALSGCYYWQVILTTVFWITYIAAKVELVILSKIRPTIIDCLFVIQLAPSLTIQIPSRTDKKQVSSWLAASLLRLSTSEYDY